MPVDPVDETPGVFWRIYSEDAVYHRLAYDGPVPRTLELVGLEHFDPGSTSTITIDPTRASGMRPPISRLSESCEQRP